MKNRLELAKKLLREDGSIFVQCDDNEQAYLKVLMDEVLDRENYIANVIWNHTKQSKNDERFFSRHYNSLLVYAKNKNALPPFLMPRQESDNKAYQNPDNDPKGLWRSGDVRSPNLRETLRFKLTAPNGNLIEPPINGWRWSKSSIEEKIKAGEIIFKKDGSGIIRKIYLKDQKGRTPENIWYAENSGTSRNANSEIKDLFNETIFSTPKPEKLIERIIQIATNPSDLVLDFHLGSGTTAAVAHKMGRRYIGVEQMDYIQDITVERLKKVLEGEQGGISKSQNWHGGGSFVYCELKEDANTLINTIQNATEDTIESVKASIYADERIVPYLTKQELADADKDFENLTLEEKKRVLTKLIDKNKLYVNASDMDDETYQISDADKAFTKSFYEEA